MPNHRRLLVCKAHQSYIFDTSKREMHDWLTGIEGFLFIYFPALAKTRKVEKKNNRSKLDLLFFFLEFQDFVRA